MKNAAAAMVALMLAACSSGADVVAPQATVTVTETVTETVTVAAAESTPPQDAPSAREVVEAFEGAGLEVGDVRDNSDNCEVFGCVQQITTDYVSVYQWGSPAEAEQNVSTGPGRETYVAGSLVAHFGGDSDFWPFDIGPYVEVMEEAAS